MTGAQAGVYGELVAAAYLQSQGWYVFPSVGSHGPIDLVAVRHGQTRLFDVKICRVTVNGQPRKDKSLTLTDEQKALGVELLFVTREGEVLNG